MMFKGLLLLVVVLLSTICTGKGKKAFTAQVVENIVQNEIAKKMPAAAAHSRKKYLTGVHLKEATDAINKLVDESIVDRVQEAEKEVSQMLLKSIEHHIQDAGKVLLKQDENTCRDKLESCDKLAESGVCESSKDAMVVNCPQTCNFCGMLEDLKSSAKEEKVQDDIKSDGKLKKKVKKHPKKKVKKIKHKHKAANLAPEEVRLIHENMLDQTIDHANLPMATQNAPSDPTQYEPSVAPPSHESYSTREYDDDQKEAEEERAAQKEKEQEELEEEQERQKEEENERKKKKAAMHKARVLQTAAAAPEELKGSLLPPSEDAIPTSNIIQAFPTNMMQFPLVATAGISSYPVNTFTSSNGKRRNKDLTETDVTNRNKEEHNDNESTQSSVKNAFSSVKSALAKVKPSSLTQLLTPKKKTDKKLKHEIENMVDKAFGEFLL